MVICSVTTSQDASHRTGLKLRALDINQSRSHVVLAGGKILKTVRVDGSNCIEDFNIRSAAVNYAWERTSSGGSSGKKKLKPNAEEGSSSAQRETFDIEDVAWSNGSYSHHIATAASNGKIMLYDMERPGVEIGRLHEHYRQVHKVDFNPIEGQFLLSGSQDGTVRLWDLRAFQKNVMTCYSKGTFPGRSDGVRHTKWSPVDTWSFALGTDNGTVQRWDTRQNRTPILKISAHTDTCNSIDWHPDGRHLVSAGKDQNVNVWNLAADRQQKPTFQIRAPREVQNVRWRPPCYIAESPDQYIKQCTFLATAYRHSPVVHVWDLRRPFMPFKSIHHQINGGTTDMLWQSKDMLWTVGPQGEFLQSDVRYAPRTGDRRSTQTIAWATNGELTFFGQKRAVQPQPWRGDDFNADSRSLHGARESADPDSLPSHHGFGDDSFEERFLSSSFPRKHSRTSSFQAGVSLGSTPPSQEDFLKPVTQLDHTMRQYESVVSQRCAKSGTLPAAASTSAVFTILARRYQFSPLLKSLEVSSAIEMEEIFLNHVKRAQRANRYRDAQTWKLLGHELSSSLKRLPKTNVSRDADKLQAERADTARCGVQTTLKNKTSHERASRAVRIKTKESSSNFPTPIARPVKISKDTAVKHNVPFEVEPHEQLPQSVIVHSSAIPLSGRDAALATNLGMLVGSRSESRDLDLSTKSISIPQYKARSKPLLNLDPISSMQTEHINIPARLDRHDSNESFEMFSNSVGSPRNLSIRESPVDGSFNSSTSRNSIERIGVSNDSVMRPYESSSESGRDYEHSYGNLYETMSIASTGASSPVLEARNGIVARRIDESEITRVQSGEGRVESAVTRALASNQRMRVGQDLPSNSQKKEEESHAPIPKDHTQGLNAKDAELEHLREELDRAMAASLPNPSTKDPQRRNKDPNTQKLNSSEENSDTLAREDSLTPALDTLRQTLDWCASYTDAQMASHLYLMSWPFLQSAIHDSSHVNNGSKIEDAGFTHEYITHSSSLSDSMIEKRINHLTALESAGISPAFIEALILSYHDQLTSLNIHTQAALLRRHAYPSFPAVYESALKNVEIGLLCQTCRNPITKLTSTHRCDICKTRQADCPICWSRQSPYTLPAMRSNAKRLSRSIPTTSPLDNHPPTDASYTSPLLPSMEEHNITPSHRPTTKLWTSCTLCNHSSHAACSWTWFHDPESRGACPVAGCLCDCSTGQARTERLARKANREAHRVSRGPTFSAKRLQGAGDQEHKRRQSQSGRVRMDDWQVDESRAVRSMTRSLLRHESSGAVSDGETSVRSDSYRRQSGIQDL